MESNRPRNLGIMLSFLVLGVIFLLVICSLGSIIVEIEKRENTEEKVELELQNKDEYSHEYNLILNGYSTFLPNPAPLKLIQPDGGEFTAKIKAEKIGGHVETINGYSIVMDENGWWTYAQKDERGVLVPTTHRVGIIDPELIDGIQKHLENNHPDVPSKENYNLRRSTRAPPAVGTWKAIALMLNFTDFDFGGSHDQAHFRQLLNDTASSSMRTYYRGVSYGIFDIEVDVVGPFQSSHSMAYYGADNHGLDTGNGPVPRNIYEMAREAVQLADPSVDFSQYDIDSDGEIDALFIIHAGSGQEQSGNSNDIWSHKSTIGFTGESVDGVIARPYSTEPEDGEIGVFAHEFGHVLGLPDLYDRDYSSNGIGDWGLMAGGSWNGAPTGSQPAHFCAWSKIMLGWIEPIIVTSDVSLSAIEIPPVENNTIVYKMWAHESSTNTSEYFLITNRQKIGYDNALPGEGILIWHVDDSVTTQNDDETHYLVDLEEADGNPPNNAGDAWKNSVLGFRDSTDPNSDSYNGSSTGVWIWNISDVLPGNNMTLGFNEINTGPTGIYIIDPVSDITIIPAYDFILNDTDFPDEDVDTGSGTYVIQYSPAGMDLWSVVSPQTPKGWIGGVGGIVNCSALPNGTWDFRGQITDEEGYVYYTPKVSNIKLIDLAPPVADAGYDNFTGTDSPILLDGSNSSDDSGYIAWYNWSFGDGNFLNGSGPIYSKVLHIYTVPGNYTVVLNVSDAQGNWDVDTVKITVNDTSPPITNLTIDTPKYRENITHDWNITRTTNFYLSAYDIYSGVNFTWYSIDGQYFEFEGNPFNLSGYSEGPHYIIYGSEDGIGNNDTGSEITIWIDESKPITSLSISGLKYPDLINDGCNVTSSSGFTLSGTDRPIAHNAGINFTWYIIDGDYSVGTFFNLAGYGEGAHSISWGSEDNLGHNETDKSVVVWVDESHPKTDLIINPPKYPKNNDEGCNVTSYTQFTLSASDNPITHSSGINFTWYIIDGNYSVGTSFNLSGLGEGIHNITWGSEDNLFYNETNNSISVWVDDSLPQTQLIPGSPLFPSFPYDGCNITSSTQFTLSGEDKPGDHNAGINFTWYSIDGDYSIGTSFNLSGYSEGRHTVSWGSLDNVDHNETNTISVWLDNSPPKTNLTIGSEKFPIDGFDSCNVTSYTTFTLSPQDYPAHNSGIKQPWYTVDGAYFGGSNFTLSLFGLNEGPHSITWGSIDNLGQNESGNHIVVYLDKLHPDTKIEVGGPKWRDFPNEYYNVTHSTPFTLNATDSYSGIAFSWYFIEGEYFEGSYFNLSGYDDGVYTIVYGSQDNLGHNETQKNITVLLDNISPNSTLSIGVPKYRSHDLDIWNITASTVFMIISNDNSSGVEIEWYIIDDDYFEDWILNLNGYSDGNHTITYGTRDRLGNNETGKSIIIWLDNSAPKTNLTIDMPKHPMWPNDGCNVTSSTQFVLSAQDTPDFQNPGVNFTWYTIDGNYYIGSTFNLSEYKEGSHIITWGSVDNLTINETGNSIVIWVDDSAPETELTIDSQRYPLALYNGCNVTNKTLFTLSGLDKPTSHNARVNVTWYTIDGVYFEGVEFNLSDYTEGTHTITWGSRDSLNHNETGNSLIVYLDITSPTTVITIGEPKYQKEELHIWNITQATIFNLISDDDQSGVSFIWYTIDGEYHEGSNFMLTGQIDGLHYISWGAQDNLGNNEKENTLMVNVDTTAPVAEIYFGGEVPSMDERNTINSSTLITVMANDSIGVGIDFIWYSLDGGLSYEIYDSPFTVPLNTSTIIFGARDILGNNASGIMVRINVDDREPVIDNGDGNGNGNGDGDGDTGDGDIEPSDFDIFEILMDYLYLIILIIIITVVLVVILALSRKRKGKEETVAFQTEDVQEVTAFQVEEEKNDNLIEFKEDDKLTPPPPPPPPE
ncbi:MAG: M6 family metalloprotease domain-containing protein [Thermoplasmata archaeon]|nr:MAG: M6 family metalloprotease domain-containing protein [Thermoplasmata archaeon]